MARTKAGAALTEAHRLEQRQLSVKAIAALLEVWPLLDASDLDGTARRWLTAAAAIVSTHHDESARLAQQYLTLLRQVEVGPPPADWAPPTPAPLNMDAVRTSLLVQGPIRVKASIAAGRPLPSALETAATTMAAAGSRHALHGGRSVVMGAGSSDPAVVGVRRVAASSACPYCAAAAGITLPPGEEVHRYHDGCHCQLEPDYTNPSNPETSAPAGPPDSRPPAGPNPTRTPPP